MIDLSTYALQFRALMPITLRLGWNDVDELDQLDAALQGGWDAAELVGMIVRAVDASAPTDPARYAWAVMRNKAGQPRPAPLDTTASWLRSRYETRSCGHVACDGYGWHSSPSFEGDYPDPFADYDLRVTGPVRCIAYGWPAGVAGLRQDAAGELFTAEGFAIKRRAVG